MRHRVLFGPNDGVLGGVLGAVLCIELVAVLVVPAIAGYPHGGIFLLDVLPFLGAAALLGAVMAIPALVAGRDRFGAVASIAFFLALVALAAGDAWLWVACVASV